MGSSTLSVRMKDEERKLFEEYAKLNGVGLSTLFKQALEERIEDELDIKAIEEYEEDVKEGTTETVSWEQAEKILDMDN